MANPVSGKSRLIKDSTARIVERPSFGQIYETNSPLLSRLRIPRPSEGRMILGFLRVGNNCNN